MERNTEVSRFFVGREKKGQAAFPPLGLLRGREGVVQNRNGKTSRADQRSVSERGGLEWSFCTTSAAALECLDELKKLKNVRPPPLKCVLRIFIFGQYQNPIV
ncbi:hypothetical protein ACFQZJ_02315 [Maribacter chungangensis]|uniref:Uncharacterized protein n=1 Tax=Maribacter chungangensis TaxID=1069117 RepID=A0ABW3B0X9_9FLAO